MQTETGSNSQSVGCYRIQLSHQKGWRMPPGTRKVDGSTIFGNPFQTQSRPRADAVRMFREWLMGAHHVACEGSLVLSHRLKTRR